MPQRKITADVLDRATLRHARIPLEVILESDGTDTAEWIVAHGARLAKEMAHENPETAHSIHVLGVGIVLGFLAAIELAEDAAREAQGER